MIAGDVINSGRGSVGFAKYRLLLPVAVYPKGYPQRLKAISDHIRKRRMDIGLYQRQVAELIGVSESTIWNWERGIEPELRFIPKIIEFLGYNPFTAPTDLLGRLRHFKIVNGLSYIRLGDLMNRDPEQLTDWLTGRKRPCKKNVRKIESFLAKKGV